MLFESDLRIRTSRKSFATSASLRRFTREEDGGLIIFTLFILICMLLAIGMAIDTVRTEFTRIKMQNVTDAAVLAAADLDQTLDPKSVVEDHLRRAGLNPDDVQITVTQGIDSRQVSAVTNYDVPTMFMNMVGIKDLSAPAAGTAMESVSELEIALVLDNSGSMASNSNYRMNLLKPAAKNFVEQVLDNDSSDGKVAISIIPFATQVTAGAGLLSQYKVSDEHSYSHCVTFDDADFSAAKLSTTQPLNRTAHFDPSNTRMPPYSSSRVCRTDTSREITPWSDDVDYLKGRIDAMVGSGWTSIEIGAKWGAALLDPSSRPVLTALIEDKTVDAKFAGQPFDYGSSDAEVSRMKYLVIMSDGENTSQYDIKSPYRDGLSPLFLDGDTASLNNLSYYDADHSGDSKYYRFDISAWRQQPTGQDNARQLSWPEVWDMMSVKYYVNRVEAKVPGLIDRTTYSDVVTGPSSTTKNTRTSNICKAAKDAGVLVFTIGMDTYGQGDTTLADCASGPSYFYDVESDDLDQAFTSIARTINQLRLTN
ncbi:pilus assembly protein TadG-related protein [Aliiruegeria lutimaris]|uniref:Flp pilus assembly protein TadG n=1 Tax=Aliiruegeria lutimaris TaxID=571298 RepID=A0A1G9AVW9_9RHOB|nr:pilus assembly protein TadG-related protein [Aliiruegeria lutimaris]SDK31387.1 Flp pilus assembly protein TadG [Aliiruegeria lutimaris]